MSCQQAFRNCTLLLLLASPSFAQSLDAQGLLDRIRTQVAATVERAPHYTCVESIERHWYANRRPARPGCNTDRPPEIVARNLVRSDRLRLDVGVVDGQEIFSWQGARKFRTDDIDELVTGGPISSGSYASFLSSIFLEGIAKVDYLGLRAEGSKQLAAFGYSVPIGQSKFQTETRDGKQVMGYHGQFLADSSTGDLEELDVITDDMPAAAWVCGFSSEAHYKSTLLGNRTFQLPTNVTMTVLDVNHEHTQTFTQYQACREFVGQSTLSFEGAPNTSAAQTPAAARSLPAGLALKIRLESLIDPLTAWAGDPIEGQLVNDIRDAQNSVLIPRGADVYGRLLRFETWVKPANFYTGALTFERLRWQGQDYSLHLKAVSTPVYVSPGGALLQRRVPLANPAFSDDLSAARFRVNSKREKLKDVTTYWVTE